MNKKSGLTSLAGQVRAAGRGRDTVLAHITPEEAALLKARGGRGSTNPVTGLPEFEDDFSYSAPMDFGYSAPSYSYSLPDLYSPPSYDYYSQNYGGTLPIDYGSSNILNYSNQASYNTVNDIYNNNINNLTNNLSSYSPTVDIPIDYSYLNQYQAPATDFIDPGYYDQSPTVGYTAPETSYTLPAETVNPTGGYTAPSTNYALPTEITSPAVVAPYEPLYEPPQYPYNDPTANLRSDILGGFTPDAFYRSQYAPEFANEIYSNINPNFSVDEQGNPVEANAPTTGDVTTAPLAGDFVDAQGNLTREGLAPEVTPTIEDNLADLPSENATEAKGNLGFMTPAEKRAYAANQAMSQEATSLKDLIDESAKAAGTDPRTLYGIVKGESLRGDSYDTNISKKEESYGPFQLNRMGGLGATFEKETGLDLADPKTIPAQTRWVAEYLAQHPNMNVGKTWYGYRGDADWGDTWGNAGLTPPSAPLPLPRPSDAEFQSYNNPTPPALPPMITGVTGAGYSLPQGAMSYAGQAPTLATQPAPLSSEDALSRLESLEASNAPQSQIDAASAALKEAYRREVDAIPSIADLAKNGTPASSLVKVENFGVSNPPADTASEKGADYVEGPSLTDRAVKAIPGAAADFGLGTLIPFYGPAALAAKVFGIETPGSMLGSNLTGGFANYPGSATATEYVPPIEAPAEIGKLPQTPGGTPIISEPATGPVQVPPDFSGQVTGRSIESPSTYDSAAPSAVPYASPFGTGTYALPGGSQGMSYNAPGSPGADIVSALAEPSDGAPVPKEYRAPFTAPDKAYILPEELAFAGKPETPSIWDYQPPSQSYELPGYVARMGEPQPYSPPFQPINKQYALPEELANLGKPATSSPLDYTNPSTKYVLPPSAGGVSPPGLTRSPDVSSARTMISSTGSGFTGSSIDSTLSRSGGISSLGGGGGGGTNVSVGGGGGGGGGAAKPATTSGSLGSVAARDLDFQGIAGANRQFGSPVVESGRTVDFGKPSRQLAYDLNLPAIQQAAVNPNSYRNYLSQYKQLFG